MVHRSLWIPGLVTLLICFIAGIIVSRAGFDWSPKVDTVAHPEGVVLPFEEGESKAAEVKTVASKDAPLENKLAPLLEPNMPPKVTFDLEDAFLENDRYHIELPGGYRAVLTIDPVIQDRLESVYRKNNVPHAGFVATEPKTGRVLAVVSHESSGDSKGNIALEPVAPSASIFKIITAAALIEDASITPSSRVCYHGETAKRPEDGQITGRSTHARQCTSFAEAFGESNNPVFSSLAYKHFGVSELETWAARFGYNELIAFQLKGKASTSAMPEDNLERARAAAGFRHTYLTPLHASLIAGAIGNGGIMMRPNLIETLIDPKGETIYTFAPSPYKRVMKTETARQVADLMVRTTSIGTGRKYFHEALGVPKQNFTVAGKTGTLSDSRPYLMYSWFVGFASVENPSVAVAALVCNPLKWRIKGSYAALEGIRAFVNSNDLIKSMQEANKEKNGPEPHEGNLASSDAPQDDLKRKRRKERKSSSKERKEEAKRTLVRKMDSKEPKKHEPELKLRSLKRDSETGSTAN